MSSSSNSNSNNNNRGANNGTSSGGGSSSSQACAACKYQRRKCTPGCSLAPYFPTDQQRQFLNAHKLFGVSNLLKIIRNLDPSQKDEAMRTMIIQADIRASDPVGGCYRIIQELQCQIQRDKSELQLVLHQLALCRAQAQVHLQLLQQQEAAAQPINAAASYITPLLHPHLQQQQQQGYFVQDNNNHHQGINQWVIQHDPNPNRINDAVDVNKEPFMNECEEMKPLLGVFEEIKPLPSLSLDHKDSTQCRETLLFITEAVDPPQRNKLTFAASLGVNSTRLGFIPPRCRRNTKN